MFNTYRKALVSIGLVFYLFSIVSAKYSGGTGQPNDPYQIANPNDLLVLAADTDDYNDCFILINDINLDDYNFTAAVIAPDINSLPTFQGKSFNGIFDGNGHSIISLKINTNGLDNDFLGLFGQISSDAIVMNLAVEDANIIGGDDSSHIGGLCGTNYYGSINNCYMTVAVSGYVFVGGLCGENWGNISKSYSTGNVTGYWQIGGLSGDNHGSIVNCYSTGNVTGNYTIGGLCGATSDGSINNCYSTGIVSGVRVTGGLCGTNSDGSINNCYSTSLVSGDNTIGGLCGKSSGNNAIITNSYSTGNVIGGDYSIGGLCGENLGNITKCYSTGTVTGSGYSIGGLCGLNYRSVISCYFLDTAGPDNGYGEPLTDAQMKQQTSFIGWDFSYNDGNEADWFMPIDEYPILTWQISPADIYTDGKNNFKDFAVFAEYWMRDDCRVYNDYCDWADLDFNGYVDIDDLIELISYWLDERVYNYD